MTNAEKLLTFPNQKVWNDKEFYRLEALLKEEIDKDEAKEKLQKAPLRYLMGLRVHTKEYLYKIFSLTSITSKQFLDVVEVLDIIIDISILKEDNSMEGQLFKNRLDYEKKSLVFTKEKFLIKRDESLTFEDKINRSNEVIVNETLEIINRDIKAEEIKMSFLENKHTIIGIEEQKESLEKIEYLKEKYDKISSQKETGKIM